MRQQSFWSLFRQDLTITLRNALVWFMMGTAILLIVTVRFLIPDNLELKENVYYYDATPGQFLQSALLTNGADPSFILGDVTAVEEAVAKDRTAVGLVISGSLTEPQVTLVTNNRVSDAQVNIFAAHLEQMLAGHSWQAVRIETLRPEGEPIPTNLNAIPTLLTFEVLITGFMLVAVMIFQEKQEGSIRAYRISPGTVAGYVLSKTLVFTLLSLAYGIVFIFFTLGITVNWLPLLATLILGSTLYTLLGISVSVFFNNMSEWLIMGMSVLILNFLPMISYSMPSFAPKLLTVIPSYPVVFGVAEILFPTGAKLTPMFIYLCAAVALAYAASHVLVYKKLMKEGR